MAGALILDRGDEIAKAVDDREIESLRVDRGVGGFLDSGALVVARAEQFAEACLRHDPVPAPDPRKSALDHGQQPCLGFVEQRLRFEPGLGNRTNLVFRQVHFVPVG